MKVKLFGKPSKTITWNLQGYSVSANDQTAKSKPHLRARKLLRDIFPTDPILEEVPIPGCQLRLDFFLPVRKLATEIHGRQHFEFVQFFQKDRQGFAASLQRDRDKAEWCASNGIQLLILKDTETDDEWRDRIQNG